MRGMLRGVVAAVGGLLFKLVSVTDFVFFVAIAAVAYGIALVNVAAAFIVVGSFFVLLTTWGRFK